MPLRRDDGPTTSGRPPLTPTEALLLRSLATETGRVFSRRELLRITTGAPGSWDQQRAIDVHICALRRKLAGGDTRIETVRYSGYRLVRATACRSPSESANADTTAYDTTH